MENFYTPEREAAIRKHYELEKIWLMAFVLFMLILYKSDNLFADVSLISYVFVAFLLIWIFGYGLWRFYARKKLDIALNSPLEKWTGYMWVAAIIVLTFLN